MRRYGWTTPPTALTGNSVSRDQPAWCGTIFRKGQHRGPAQDDERTPLGHLQPVVQPTLVQVAEHPLSVQSVVVLDSVISSQTPPEHRGRTDRR